ncbi:phenylacetic acid degradation protein [Alicyclobacillus sp.]|uniref:phenylacetic acid degradation protein n=1 Tax=Alicyclobacillus sp. TaxID=61169 RepID=UPI0025BD8174|nr:phenylacetic acid degradation protein [Alicyclobacillus sp.]MCL6517274.1 phenylacetic acid degradation protein [Alicyclobacillus sp.]
MRSGGVANGAGAAASRPGHEVYEVFVQSSALEPHTHVGSVLAPSAEWALQVARENFARRGTAVNLWVVRRRDIAATPADDGDFFVREFDRTYREVSGYSDNARRWKRFKARAMTMDEVMDDVRGG